MRRFASAPLLCALVGSVFLAPVGGGFVGHAVKGTANAAANAAETSAKDTVKTTHQVVDCTSQGVSQGLASAAGCAGKDAATDTVDAGKQEASSDVHDAKAAGSMTMHVAKHAARRRLSLAQGSEEVEVATGFAADARVHTALKATLQDMCHRPWLPTYPAHIPLSDISVNVSEIGDNDSAQVLVQYEVLLPPLQVAVAKIVERDLQGRSHSDIQSMVEKNLLAQSVSEYTVKVTGHTSTVTLNLPGEEPWYWQPFWQIFLTVGGLLGCVIVALLLSFVSKPAPKRTKKRAVAALAAPQSGPEDSRPLIPAAPTFEAVRPMAYSLPTTVAPAAVWHHAPAPQPVAAYGGVPAAWSRPAAPPMVSAVHAPYSVPMTTVASSAVPVRVAPMMTTP